MINGLTYIPNYLSSEEEQSIVDNIDKKQWSTELKRRVQHYGYKYDYTKRAINSSMLCESIPKFISDFIDNRLKLNDNTNYEFDQVIINEYKYGQGITKHIDCVPCFDQKIISVSLLDSCIMQFRNIYEQTKTEYLNLEPRSLLILDGEARYQWTHAIPPIKVGRRISITFRKVILQ